MNNSFFFRNSNRTYVIAEISANHQKDFEKTRQLMKEMALAGVSAIKVQTYTPDTLTLNEDNEYFRPNKNPIWQGKTDYELFHEGMMPWEWQPKLQDYAMELGVDFFSTPFDFTAVDFLEQIEVPAYKIASFELVDIPLLKKVASTGKPIIISTGMASIKEIEEAVYTLRENGTKDLVVLKCTSAYPAPPEESNLSTIADIAKRFNCISGLSDHTLGIVVPITAVALGARVIEKHVTLRRKDGGLDADFSLEPHEVKQMIDSIRIAEKTIGVVTYGASSSQESSRQYRRSLFVVEDILKGEKLTEANVRSIRPGFGLHTRYYSDVLGKVAVSNIKKGTPLSWEMIEHL